MDEEKIKQAVKDILEAVGEDPEREGLQRTPQRVAEMYEEILGGTNQEPKEVLDFFSEEEQYEDLILVKDINFYSICEHHLLPFFGRAHIAYLPDEGRITGFSRLARVVETLAKRLQLQERMTKKIADTVMEVLRPQGVVAIIEAEQMCMTMRGIKKEGSRTVTSAARGIYKDDSSARNEIMKLIE
jgi:GTP cyclohydrolase I